MNDVTVAEQRQRQHGDLLSALEVSRRPYRGRQVLARTTRKKTRPNTRLKAARHPWAERLHAARTAGFIVETEGSATFYKCYACGAGGGIAGQGSGSQEDLDSEEYFREEIYRHSTRACITGVRL